MWDHDWAGILVFPGLAAANAGLAATLSFATGGLIALLLALPTSELATAVPRSGGGYYIISRGMGTAYGVLVGLWLGLMVASAIYLVGFGHHTNAIFTEIGVGVPFSSRKWSSSTLPDSGCARHFVIVTTAGREGGVGLSPCFYWGLVGST